MHSRLQLSMYTVLIVDEDLIRRFGSKELSLVSVEYEQISNNLKVT